MGTDGSDPGDTVRCHTDLATCCSSALGILHGNWCFPDESMLTYYDSGSDRDIHRVFEFLIKQSKYIVGTMLPHHLVYIAVMFQQSLSMMMMMTSQ